MKEKYLVLLILFSVFSYSQEDKIFKAQQNAISSMSLVDALASRYPGARKYIDRMGNNAHKLISTNFNNKTNFTKLENIYKILLN